MTTIGQNAGVTTRSALVGALFDAWDDFDLVMEGVTADEMLEQWGDGSALRGG